MYLLSPCARLQLKRVVGFVLCILVCVGALSQLLVSAAALPLVWQRDRVFVDSSQPAWKSIDTQLARIGEAESKQDISALRTLYAPDFFSVQPNGEKWGVDRVLALQENGLKQVAITICLNPTIVRMELEGEPEGNTAHVTVLWDWTRMQRMAGKVRRVQTSALYEETWVKRSNGWKRLSVGNRRSCTALVDDKRVDISRSYDPEAPPYDLRDPHPRIALADMLYIPFKEQGAKAGLSQFQSLRNSPEYYVSEASLNAVGYRLLGDKKTQEAVAVFRLITQLYPRSSNAFDSLGEALLAAGEKQGAIESYRRSLKLDSKNDNAREVLKRMSGPGEKDR